MYGCELFRPEEKTLIFMSLMNGNIVRNFIKDKIKILIKNHKRKKHTILWKHRHRECLKKLHDEYVLVPTDKE